MSGTLFVVPNLLGLVPPTRVLPQRTIDVARTLRHWIVESAKPARAFLKTIDVAMPIASLDIRALSDATEVATLLAPAKSGASVGLLSDAGCPGVADPGAAIVTAAHDAGIRVVPLVGPSALLLALMASGLDGQRFAFHGYLPVKSDARTQTLRALESDSRAHRRAQLFIETPYRNVAMLEAIRTALGAKTIVCVAADLTLETETIERGTVDAWRNRDIARFDKRPALFVMQA